MTKPNAARRVVPGRSGFGLNGSAIIILAMNSSARAERNLPRESGILLTNNYLNKGIVSRLDSAPYPTLWTAEPADFAEMT
jgi:hypothetical protein